MSCFVFNPHTLLHLPSFAFINSKPPLSILSLKDTTDRPLFFASQREDSRLTVSSIRSDGSKRGRPSRENSSSRTANDAKTEITESVDGTSSSNSAKQDEIIALFRRIQSSISKGESVGGTKKSSKSPQEKSSDTAVSVLEVLRQSKKQVKDKTSKVEENKVTNRRGVSKKEQKIDTDEQKIDTDEQVVDIMPTRPPSSFVKKSPISHLTTPRQNEIEQNKSKALLSMVGGNDVVKVDEMKLTELKELAKLRGIKGYSKLKKSELLELLRP